MTWNDPELAFSPQECNRSINQFIQEYGPTFPEFTISNQQGNRWTQNQIIVINPDGTATYFERFWVKLQAPDFDFRRDTPWTVRISTYALIRYTLRNTISMKIGQKNQKSASS
ncbi:MAG: hypothetical protein MUO26_00460 [Methanotrichaceae archaeon]|nr:hypothetical protein [Methanotrichaceae archaeon]